MTDLFYRPLSAGHTWGDSVWSTVDSGAAGTHVPPTATDNAFFSSNDNSSCAVNAAASCLSLDTTKGTGWTGTLSGSFTIAISGGLNFSSTTVCTVTQINFILASSSATVNTNGVTCTTSMFFAGAGSYSLLAALSLGIFNTVSISAGSFSSGGFAITSGVFQISGSTTRSVNITNSTITVGTTSGTPLNLTSTGLTFTSTGSTINISSGSVGTSLALNFAALTYATVNITGAGLWTLNGGPTIGTFSYTSTTNKTDQLILGGNLTVTGVSVGACVRVGPKGKHRL